MLLLLLVANVATQPAPPHRIAQAAATVRIERPAIANRDEWKNAPGLARREVIIRDDHGRTVLLRIIEYQ